MVIRQYYSTHSVMYVCITADMTKCVHHSYYFKYVRITATTVYVIYVYIAVFMSYKYALQSLQCVSYTCTFKLLCHICVHCSFYVKYVCIAAFYVTYVCIAAFMSYMCALQLLCHICVHFSWRVLNTSHMYWRWDLHQPLRGVYLPVPLGFPRRWRGMCRYVMQECVLFDINIFIITTYYGNYKNVKKVVP